MKFQRYQTAYHDCKKMMDDHGHKNLSYDQYYQILEDYGVQRGRSKFEMMRLVGEVVWLEEQKPYYKFYPSILEPAERLKLDNIPANMLMIPGKTRKSVALIFPEGNRIQNILVNRVTETHLLFSIRADIDQYQYGYFICNTAQEHSIDEVIDLSTAEVDAAPKTLDDLFSRIVNPVEEIPHKTEYDFLIRQAVKYYAMAKFLTDCPNDDLMSYDLPARYIGEFVKASNNRKKAMLEWSRKHGHNGYNIGLHSRVFENAGRLSEPRQVGNGTPQEYAHIRTGHLHAVRFGEAKKHVRLQWYMPIVVNKDKAFK